MSCGKPLGSVAHIYNDRLLCENCFSQVSTPNVPQSDSAHTVLIGQHDDEQRANAFRNIPAENLTTESSGDNPEPIQVSHLALLLKGEQVVWKRTFSKGIIHRHPSITEVITNFRALVIDDALKAIVRAVPISKSTPVITNTKRVSSNVRSGYGRGGVYTGSGLGSSTTYGDIDFVYDGKVVITFYHVRDPFGVKNLLKAFSAGKGASK